MAKAKRAWAQMNPKIHMRLTDEGPLCYVASTFDYDNEYPVETAETYSFSDIWTAEEQAVLLPLLKKAPAHLLQDKHGL